jgi:hypothetical protein
MVIYYVNVMINDAVLLIMYGWTPTRISPGDGICRSKAEAYTIVQKSEAVLYHACIINRTEGIYHYFTTPPCKIKPITANNSNVFWVSSRGVRPINSPVDWSKLWNYTLGNIDSKRVNSPGNLTVLPRIEKVLRDVLILLNISWSHSTNHPRTSW